MRRSQAFVNELLDALPFVGLAGVDVALRIHGYATHAVELAWHPPAVAEAQDDFERIAQQDEDPFVVTIGDIKKSLPRILRKRDVPHRPVAEGSLRDEPFFHKLAVFLKNLNSIVLAVADIDQT